MKPSNPITESTRGQIHRRQFLADYGMGFTGLAMGSMLFRDGISKAAAKEAWAPPSGLSIHTPKAKSVIWIFLSGGYSQMETFDPKPALNKYAGKSFDDTPFADPFKNPVHDARSRSVIRKVRAKFPEILPLQFGFKKRGQSGVEISDCLPHLATCADDLSFVRNMWTTDNDHNAENQIHTGRHRLDETQPSIGSWVHYGLGSLNENLPQFVVLGGPTRGDTRESIDSLYLGPRHAGVPLKISATEPLPYGRRSPDVLASEQRNQFELIRKLNTISADKHSQDPAMLARIKSYELAFRMQMAVPEAMDFSKETNATRTQYGFDNKTAKYAAERCLAARRLIERGVRFVQLFPSRYGVWDAHKDLKARHGRCCAEIDQPVAALVKDMKQRGLLEDTMLVFCTEFGRTPGLQPSQAVKNGRDHHPHGFTIWFAGAGMKKGHIHGATDELGFHASGEGHYITDLHATVLHNMGLDPRRLEVPGRKRLEIDHGTPIWDAMA
ncbi:MAG: hypothetical protein ACI9VS_003750 [Candidatus Binatia bacterium]|jgi:hypothetical protein